MGAKLSKKKKGYCLGAGKDGESTETTEVEQKETENQEGQKDAAEPKGEKAPMDPSQNNGINEEPKDKKSEKVTTGDATKDKSTQDQKPEIKPRKKQVKDQLKGKEQDEVKSAAPEQACEKELNASEDKAKTECEGKETAEVAADKPTQESKPVKEKEGSECKESHSSETKPMAPLEDEVWVQQISKLEKTVQAEQTKKSAPGGTEDHVSVKVPNQANQSAVEPEKVPEKVEPSAPKRVSIEPVADAVASKPVSKPDVVEPEVVEPASSKPEEAAVPEKVNSALPNSDPTTEPTQSTLPEPVEPATKEPELVLEPSPVPAPVVESALPQAVPEIVIVAETALPESEPVPCPPSEKISEAKYDPEMTSEPLPPKSTEVPDEAANAQEHTENQKSLGCRDQSAEEVTIQAPATEAATIKEPSEISEKRAASESPVIQNGPSEVPAGDGHAGDGHAGDGHAGVPAEDGHAGVPAGVPTISIELMVEDEEQKEAAEEDFVLDKSSTQQESQEVNEDCKAPIDGLVTSKNENNSTTAPDTTETHDASQHCNSEDKTENRNPSEEMKIEKEPPAPEIFEKHGVGNGLPIKEEIKVHLEGKCDIDLHEMNGQSERHEIQVCNE